MRGAHLLPTIAYQPLMRLSQSLTANIEGMYYKQQAARRSAIGNLQQYLLISE